MCVLQRFCMIDKKYVEPFQTMFKEQYETIHRLETNKLRNVAKFFAHLLHSDSISWAVSVDFIESQCCFYTEQHFILQKLAGRYCLFCIPEIQIPFRSIWFRYILQLYLALWLGSYAGILVECIWMLISQIHQRCFSDFRHIWVDTRNDFHMAGVHLPKSTRVFSIVTTKTSLLMK